MFPNEIYYNDSKNNARAKNGKIDIVTEIFCFPIIFALLSLVDSFLFIRYDILKLVIYSAILFIVFMALFLIFAKNCKKNKSVIMITLFAFLFLCPSIIHKIDVAYDFAPPQEIYCEIVDAITSIDDDQTTYYLTICYNNEKIKAEVGEQVYKEYEVGDQISVLIKKGALGIEKFILNG